MEVDTDEFPYLATRQGGVEFMVMWEVLLRKLLIDLERRFSGLACGVEFDGLGIVRCVAWADKSYFLARSASTARPMVDMTVRELARNSMELKSEELFVLRSDTATVDAAQVAPLFDTGDCRRCMEDLNVLGMVISRDPAQVARARLHEAEESFGRWQTSGVAPKVRSKRRRSSRRSGCALVVVFTQQPRGLGRKS